MRIAMVCEGNAEVSGGSWSGSSKSLLTHLRSLGHTVDTVDADLYGVRRAAAAIASFSPSRKRWAVKFHLGPAGFGARSRRASTGVSKMTQPDAILQIGATFLPTARGDVPYFLYCDSNILLARHGAGTGESDAASLTDSQLQGVVDRESQVYGGASQGFHAERASPSILRRRFWTFARQGADGLRRAEFRAGRFDSPDRAVCRDGLRSFSSSAPSSCGRAGTFS